MAKAYKLSGGRKFFNRFLTALMRTGIPTGNTYLLTTTGRKSGQPRSTPVTLLIESGHRWLIAPYGQVRWVENIRASGRAQLTTRGRTELVGLRELPPEEAGPLLKTYLEKYQRVVGPFFDAKAGDPVEPFVAEADKHPAFEITGV